MINKNENRLFSIEEAASLLEIDKEKLISYMKQMGYLDEHNAPTEKAIELGLMIHSD
ncbi:hypothetical protein [Turicimonas muris]|uniref:hypothetical protein n=1 Tax=Turicimonas muris TaxID=1796652 RepID=UPI0012ECBFB7|nr:hypothetical protein [Turicimonas muris]QQQ96240.1 hypothetical protein I5Q81_09765 [Turicimonas muris]